MAARSPLVAGIRDDAVQSKNLAAVRALAAGRSVVPSLGGPRSITTPVYLFQGRIDFAFDITQAWQAFEGLGGPKKLYIGNFGHAPSTFPGLDGVYVLSQSIAWYDRHLKGTCERRRLGEGRDRQAGLGDGAASASPPRRSRR